LKIAAVLGLVRLVINALILAALYPGREAFAQTGRCPWADRR
jgi:hypothetical protein